MRSAIWGAQLAYIQGMVFGFVALIAVLAGIVYFGSSIDAVEFSRILITPKTLYFLAAIAFLAGFSERFAQDTLSKATPVAMEAGRSSDRRRGGLPGATRGSAARSVLPSTRRR